MRRKFSVILTLVLSITLYGCAGQSNIDNDTQIDKGISNLQEDSNMSKDVILNDIYRKKDVEIIKILGEPELETEFEVQQYDGNEHATWEYKSKGIKLDVVNTGQEIVVNQVLADKQCKSGTSKEIFIGSTEDQVRTAYGDTINLEESKTWDNTIVVGSVYDGIVFKFEDGKVISIFIGVAAE